jgi:hypothetical protein
MAGLNPNIAGSIQAPDIFGAIEKSIESERAIRQAPILEAMQQQRLEQGQFNLGQAPILAAQQQQLFERGQQEFDHGQIQRTTRASVKLAEAAKNIPLEQREQWKQSIDPAQLQAAGIDPQQFLQAPIDEQSIDNIISSGTAFLTMPPQQQALQLRERELLERQERNRTEADRAGAVVAAKLQAEKGLKADVAGEVVSAQEAAKAKSTIGAQKIIKEQINIDETKIKNAETRQEVINGKITRKAEADNAVSTVQDLLTGDLFSSAFGRFNNAPRESLRSQANIDARSKVDQIVGLLGLESRQKLKGQGTISDSESKMLAKSATVLDNPLISDEVARKELRRIERIFQDSSDRNTLKRETSDQQQAAKGFDLEFDPATGTFK